jgi:hypothetical protein
MSQTKEIEAVQSHICRFFKSLRCFSRHSSKSIRSLGTLSIAINKRSWKNLRNPLKHLKAKKRKAKKEKNKKQNALNTLKAKSPKKMRLNLSKIKLNPKNQRRSSPRRKS